MAPISPGKSKLGRPARKSQGTAPQNKHRFESFNKRINRIKIDPVHTVETKPVQEDDSNLSQSHFRAALDEWVELNQSQTFTTFVREVNNISENLPQLLHHASDIFERLATGIEKHDALALEPLLSLLAHLARDLGVAFETYFAQSVELVAKAASTHNDAEVVEWCFTCLAWMFKYLARLLVQDLRPLFRIMGPHMSAKKEYVRRFTAESLAFLLRKAALLSRKRKNPLLLALNYLLETTRTGNDEDRHRYSTSVKSLLIETVMGVDMQMHNSTPELVACLLDIVVGQGIEQDLDLLEGFLTGVLHRTDSDNFEPLFRLIEVHLRECYAISDLPHMRQSVRLLHIMVGVRKGSRIPDWKATLQLFLESLPLVFQESPLFSDLHQASLTTVAMLIQYAPSIDLAHSIQPILDFLTRNVSSRDFFAFTSVTSDLGEARFVELLQRPLQQYIIKHFAQDASDTALVLHDMRNVNFSSVTPRHKVQLMNSQETIQWEHKVLNDLKQPLDSNIAPTTIPLIYAMQLSENALFMRQNENLSSLRHQIGELIVNSISRPGSFEPLERRLCVGDLFCYYLGLQSLPSFLTSDIWTHVFRAPAEIFRVPSFLRACVELLDVQQIPDEISDTSRDRVQTILLRNLLDGSNSLRQNSISLLTRLRSDLASSHMADLFQHIHSIMAVPYTLANAREIAMQLRRLPPLQDRTASDATSQLILPFFCLGQLSTYHDQLRKEMSSIFGLVVRKCSLENEILEILLSWLQKGVSPPATSEVSQSNTGSGPSPFECTNVAFVNEVSTQKFSRFENSNSTLIREFEKRNQLEAVAPPVSARALAMEVLLEVPDIAEKKSRLLIPTFLDAQLRNSVHLSSLSSDSSASSHTLSPEGDTEIWSFTERRMFLNLLNKFINPKVLYRAEDLQKYLLGLLTNGSSDTRKLALGAIFTWKDPSLIKYKDFLSSVAENTAASTDVGLALDQQAEENPIETSDRASVMPVLLRLLFGQIVGRSKAPSSQESRRKAILRMLLRMQESEVNMFLDIALGDLAKITETDIKEDATLDGLNMTFDQQYGLLRLLLSILETLQSSSETHGGRMVNSIVYCINLTSGLPSQDQQDRPSSTLPALLQNLRRTGLRCLELLFQYCPKLDWDPYISSLFRHIIDPRMATFEIENTQGVSALMRIFGTWAGQEHLLQHLSKHNTHLMSKLWKCMAMPSAQATVRKYILQDVAFPLVEFASTPTLNPAAAEIISQQIDPLLKSITAFLGKSTEKEVLLLTTTLLSRLAPFASSKSSINTIVHLLLEILQEPGRKISPQLKSSILKAISDLIKSDSKILTKENQEKLQSLVSGFFNYFKDEPNRILLCQLLTKLHKDQENMKITIKICADLNAVSAVHLDEPDFETRFSAFILFNELDVGARDSNQIEPILNNLIYFIRSDLDFSIRSNATSSLKNFVSRAAMTNNLQEYSEKLLLPAFERGVTEESELVRADFVALYGCLVQALPQIDYFSELAPLLHSNDEEASFFTNILHIQQHRRVRAMRRLLLQIEQGRIRSSTISKFFLPIVEKFVFDTSADESSQSMRGVAITSMRSLLTWLTWRDFRLRFRQYKTDLETKPGNEKTTIKLLDHAADALRDAWTEKHREEVAEGNVRSHLSTSLPADEVVLKELRETFLNKLRDFIHYKDEAELSTRLPAAIVAVKLTSILPSLETPLITAPIVLDVAQVLRSRAQESRDIARNTLAEVYGLLGPSSMQFIIKELRSVLTRGSQLHVLSFTLHTLLLTATTGMEPGDLNYCITDLVGVIMDDIFGLVGQEKENPDYLSTMREVKSSKSLDSMEILAQITSSSHLHLLIDPVQVLLSGSVSSKMTRQVDELLRRIGSGLTKNPSANSQELLIFSYQLIQKGLTKKVEMPQQKLTNDERNRHRYLVQLSSAGKTSLGIATPSHHKLIRFAIDVLRSALQRHSELLTTANLHGFLPVLGDCLLDAHEDVKSSTFRLLSAIIKLPMVELDRNAPVYIKEAVKMISTSSNTNDEGAQAGLKFISTMLRERKNAVVLESDIAEVLHRITPDLDEPDRQGISFNFVRAIMSRRMQLPELYEIADKIGMMIVTSHSRSARDVARQAYVHFLIDYPQTTGRWTKQKKFLLKNLEYEHAEGRQSVLETIHLLVQKVSTNIKESLIDEFMVAVLLVMVNDDHESCREMAALVVSQLFKSAMVDQRRKYVTMIASWSEQYEKMVPMKLGLQTYAIYLDSIEGIPDQDLTGVRDCLTGVLQRSSFDNNEHWELNFYALQLLLKLIKTYPKIVTSQQQTKLWTRVRALLTNPQAWIQNAAAESISLLLQSCLSSNTSKTLLTTPYGLRIDDDAAIDILRSSIRILGQNGGNSDLNAHVLPILALLGRNFDARTVLMPDQIHPVTEEESASSEEDDQSDDEAVKPQLSAIQYMLIRLSKILRREPKKMTSTALLPKQSSLELLVTLIPHLSMRSLSDSAVDSLLLPLIHLTDPNTVAPRSVSDQTFSLSYQSLVESAQNVMETLQTKLGDQAYVAAMTRASRLVRQRRDERRVKRRIERVAEPEKAAQLKRRKADRKKEKKRETVHSFRKGRRMRGDF